MNGDEALELAEERLLSAGLAELALEPRAALSRGWQAWLRVAMLLLGVTVVLGTAWYVRTDRDASATQALQEPEPLPRPTRIEGRQALEQLLREAPGTRNLWAVVLPADLELVGEFVHVERLLIEAQTPPADGHAPAPGGWNLLPLTRLERLESVAIGYCEGVAVDEIARLAALPRLREFKLIGTVHTVDGAMGEALRGMSLQRVSLEAVRVTPAGLDALVAMLGLERLEFGSCVGLDECDLARLGSLKKLRVLHLRGVGGRLAAALATGVLQAGAPPRVLLTPAVMQALAKLPDLRELVLDSSSLDASVLAALPARLERLGLRECLVADEDDFRRCAELPQLRAVSCSVPELLSREQAPDGFSRRQAAMCSLLDRQPLRELRFLGTVTDAMAASLGQQLALEEMDFQDTSQKDGLPLGLIATLPKLRRLRLLFVDEKTDPAPLAKLPKLQRVELHEPTAAVLERFRLLLGDRVVVSSPDY